MKILRWRASRALAAAVLAGTGFAGVAGLALSTSTPVHADPSLGTAFVGVGSDTIQDVIDAYAGADPWPGQTDSTGGIIEPAKYFAPLASGADSGGLTLTSWDATTPTGTAAAPGCISPAVKLGGPSIDRPNGSGGGIAALGDALGNNSTGAGNFQWWNTGATASCTGHSVSVLGQIDFARSSNGPSGAVGSVLQYVPFARDAMTYLYFDHGTNEIGLGNSLTTNQLAQLYSNTTVGANNAGELTLGNGHLVKGCSLNPSSGSWKFWIKQLNAKNTNATVVTAASGAAVGTHSGCSVIEENGGNTFVTQTGLHAPGTTDLIMPFSVGSWIAQANGNGVDRSANARLAANHTALGDPDLVGNNGTTFLPYDGVAPTEAPNHAFYASTTWGRNVWVVLPYNLIYCNTVTCNQNSALAELFTTQTGAAPGGAGTTVDQNGVGFTAAICSASAQATALSFGFDNQIPAPDTCGDVTAANSAPITG